MITELKALFLRDLDALEKELHLYPKASDLWIKADSIANTGGTLFIHLNGNLQHFIGAVLHQSGYKRDREFEFSGKQSLSEIQEQIKETKRVVSDCFDFMDESVLSQSYTLQPLGYPMSVGYFLMHLQGHLNYHLGQINYHRRIFTG